MSSILISILRQVRKAQLDGDKKGRSAIVTRWRCPIATGLPQAIGARLGIPLSADNSLVLGLNFGWSVLISKAAYFQLVVGLDVAGPALARYLHCMYVPMRPASPGCRA